MSTKLEPLFARVVLKRALEKKSRGGIIIPDNQQKRNSKPIGEVIAVGPTCDESIKVGDVVLLGKMAGDWITDFDTEESYYICQDEDILCIVHEGV